MSGEGIAVPALPDPKPGDGPQEEAQFRRMMQLALTEIGGRMKTLGETSSASGLSYMPAGGRWFRPGYLTSAVATTGLPIEDRLYYVPFIPHRTVYVSELAIDIFTGQASNTTRIGIYDSSGTDFVPDALLAESGDLDTTSTGVKSYVISPTIKLTAGLVYWVAAATQSGGGTVATHYLIGAVAENTGLGYSSAVNAFTTKADFAAYQDLAAAWTALPDPAGTVSWETDSPAPLVAVEIST